MNQRRRVVWIAGVAGLFLLSVMAATGQEKAPDETKEDVKRMAEAIRKACEANMAAVQNEDLAKVQATIHSKSPSFEAGKPVRRRLFAIYDVKYKLLSFRYVGKDGEYAIARAKQETVKLRGPAFRNNVIDAFHVFRKESGQWKLWATTVLETEFLDDELGKE